MSTPRWIILDWAGNACFDGKVFRSFDIAWEYLQEQFPDDDQLPSDEQNLQEYHVEEYP